MHTASSRCPPPTLNQRLILNFPNIKPSYTFPITLHPLNRDYNLQLQSFHVLTSRSHQQHISFSIPMARRVKKPSSPKMGEPHQQTSPQLISPMARKSRQVSGTQTGLESSKKLRSLQGDSLQPELVSDASSAPVARRTRAQRKLRIEAGRQKEESLAKPQQEIASSHVASPKKKREQTRSPSFVQADEADVLENPDSDPPLLSDTDAQF